MGEYMVGRAAAGGLQRWRRSLVDGHASSCESIASLYIEYAQMPWGTTYGLYFRNSQELSTIVTLGIHRVLLPSIAVVSPQADQTE